MTTYGIYDATNWDDNVITITIQECYFDGNYWFAQKINAKKHKIKVSDEDNKELCREEIREYVRNLNINVHNIDSKFSIK
jgi:hypothetical protein